MAKKPFSKAKYGANLYGLGDFRPIQVSIDYPLKGTQFEYTSSLTEGIIIRGLVRDSEWRYGINKIKIKIKRIPTDSTQSSAYWNSSNWVINSTWIDTTYTVDENLGVYEWQTAKILFDNLPARFEIEVQASDNQNNDSVVIQSFYKFNTEKPSVSISTPIDLSTINYDDVVLNGYNITGTTLGGYLSSGKTETIKYVLIRINEQDWNRVTLNGANWSYKWFPQRDGETKIEVQACSMSDILSDIEFVTVNIFDDELPQLMCRAVPEYVNQAGIVKIEASDNLGITGYLVREVTYPSVQPTLDDPSWVDVDYEKTLSREVRIKFK